jgi:hypothetical protein
VNGRRRIHGCGRTAPGRAGRRLALLRRSAGGVAGTSRRGNVVAVQVVALHQPDQRRAIRRVGRIDAGQRVGERIRIVPGGHCLGVVAARGQQLSVVVDALGDVVVDAETGYLANCTPVLVLGGGQVRGACRTGALDAEQVVVLAGQTARAPARLVDGLGDRYRCGHAVPALRRYRAWRDGRDKRLLRGRGVSGRFRNRNGRGLVPLVRKTGQIGQCTVLVATRTG